MYRHTRSVPLRSIDAALMAHSTGKRKEGPVHWMFHTVLLQKQDDKTLFPRPSDPSIPPTCADCGRLFPHLITETLTITVFIPFDPDTWQPLSRVRALKSISRCPKVDVRLSDAQPETFLGNRNGFNLFLWPRSSKTPELTLRQRVLSAMTTDKLWHYMETLPGIMPGNTQTPAPPHLPPPPSTSSVHLWFAISVFLRMLE